MKIVSYVYIELKKTKINSFRFGLKQQCRPSYVAATSAGYREKNTAQSCSCRDDGVNCSSKHHKLDENSKI